MLVDLRLFRDVVILQFEEKIFRAKSLLEPIHHIARLVNLIFYNPIGNLTGEAAGHRDQTFLVRGENFLINTWLVIIAFEMRGGRKFDEIFVAGGVLRKQAEMMINIAPAASTT